MNIGAKIRSLRVAKLMTQSELAGNQITRNMLSCIENGTAQPSLSTILYIASRLNVPVGFLLAEEGDEIIYQKANSLANIKRAYKAGDLAGCRSLCFSSCPEPDDEIRFLIADCDLGIAQDAFWKGQVRVACRFFDEALRIAEETLYSMPHIRAIAEVYFRYMQRISPTLYSDALDEAVKSEFFCKTAFSEYVNALDAIDRGDASLAIAYPSAFSEENRFCADHLRIQRLMLEGKYEEGKCRLLSLLESEILLNEVELYAVLCDLEICCRETEDFKGAYRYANEKVQLLEQLLKAAQ